MRGKERGKEKGRVRGVAFNGRLRRETPFRKFLLEISYVAIFLLSICSFPFQLFQKHVFFTFCFISDCGHETVVRGRV